MAVILLLAAMIQYSINLASSFSLCPTWSFSSFSKEMTPSRDRIIIFRINGMIKEKGSSALKWKRHPTSVYYEIKVNYKGTVIDSKERWFFNTYDINIEQKGRYDITVKGINSNGDVVAECYTSIFYPEIPPTLKIEEPKNRAILRSPIWTLEWERLAENNVNENQPTYYYHVEILHAGDVVLVYKKLQQPFKIIELQKSGLYKIIVVALSSGNLLSWGKIYVYVAEKSTDTTDEFPEEGENQKISPDYAAPVQLPVPPGQPGAKPKPADPLAPNPDPTQTVFPPSPTLSSPGSASSSPPALNMRCTFLMEKGVASLITWDAIPNAVEYEVVVSPAFRNLFSAIHAAQESYRRSKPNYIITMAKLGKLFVVVKALDSESRTILEETTTVFVRDPTDGPLRRAINEQKPMAGIGTWIFSWTKREKDNHYRIDLIKRKELIKRFTWDDAICVFTLRNTGSYTLTVSALNEDESKLRWWSKFDIKVEKRPPDPAMPPNDELQIYRPTDGLILDKGETHYTLKWTKIPDCVFSVEVIRDGYVESFYPSVQPVAPPVQVCSINLKKPGNYRIIVIARLKSDENKIVAWGKAKVTVKEWGRRPKQV